MARAGSSLTAAYFLVGAFVLRPSAAQTALAGASLLPYGITPVVATAEHAYGRAAAISGDGKWALVGATGYDNMDPVHFGNSGIVIVHAKDANGVWVRQAQLESPDGITAGAQFGNPLALNFDGTCAAISESQRNGPTGTSGTGYVHIMSRVGSSWTRVVTISHPSGPLDTVVGNNNFGYALALSADCNTLVASTLFTNSVYVFRRSSGTWNVANPEKLSPPGNLNIPSSSNFGNSVSMSADDLVSALAGTAVAMSRTV
jgi:hypothetical protein